MPEQKWIAKINPKLPSYSFICTTDSLTRAQVSILMQLWMGHAPLNRFLQCIGKVSPLLCPACSKDEETVHHFLFDCPTHTHARHSLAKKLGHLSKSLRHLLSNWRSFKTVLKYVGETGQFRETYGDLCPKPD